jgi:mannose-6-phosphate isomerase-like protein (cupin superfamily)
VGPGRVLVIPRGAVHRFDNFRRIAATLLTVITPGILGPSCFREVADLYMPLPVARLTSRPSARLCAGTA